MGLRTVLLHSKPYDASRSIVIDFDPRFTRSVAASSDADCVVSAPSIPPLTTRVGKSAVEQPLSKLTTVYRAFSHRQRCAADYTMNEGNRPGLLRATFDQSGELSAEQTVRRDFRSVLSHGYDIRHIYIIILCVRVIPEGVIFRFVGSRP